MSAIDFSERIERGFRDARQTWDAVQGVWNDDKAHGFEQKYWSEIDSEIHILCQIYGELEDLIQQSRKVR